VSLQTLKRFAESEKMKQKCGSERKKIKRPKTPPKFAIFSASSEVVP
jgi:hypothetical protein